MSFDSMLAVAQGRIWTGRQAFDRSLVDILGGFWKALDVAAKLSDYYPATMPTDRVVPIRIQTYSDTPMGLAALLRGGLQAKQHASRLAVYSFLLTMCADEVSWTGLAAAESLGISPDMQRLGVSPTLAHWLRQEAAESFLTAVGAAEGRERMGLGGMPKGLLSALVRWLM